MNKDAFIDGFVKAATPIGFWGGLYNTMATPFEWAGKYFSGTKPLSATHPSVPKVEVAPVRLPGVGDWWRNKSSFFPVNTEGEKEWGGLGHAAGIIQQHPVVKDLAKSWGALPNLAKWLIPMGGMALLGGAFRGGGGSPNITVNVPPAGGGSIPSQAMFRTPTAGSGFFNTTQ
jgi:hypothetical protein